MDAFGSNPADLNGEMIDRLVEAMAPEQLAQLIYVAGSALVTGPNLTRLATQQIAFVSRCPETSGAVKQVTLGPQTTLVIPRQYAL